MDTWYKMDILLNITGPFTRERINEKTRKESEFWVGGPGSGTWMPFDEINGHPPEVGKRDPETKKDYTDARVLERGIDELIGLCKGIIADGTVEPSEANFLKSWLDNNPEIANMWPANVLTQRISSIFEDGVVDTDEQADLAELLAKLTGTVPGVSDAEQLATRLPIDDPGPDVEYRDKKFCLTGKFIYGTRQKCERIILAKGGICQAQPNFDTDYLVIGALGNSEWLHSSYGRKIEMVLSNRKKGAKTAIISEEHWTFFIH